MFFTHDYRRVLLLTEGRLGVFSSKTAVSFLRYRPDDVVGILDSSCAGTPLKTIVPDVKEVPIFATVGEAAEALAAAAPDAILIGIAPTGGALPPAMREHIVEGLRRGVSIISGLHTLLKDDPELVRLAAATGARLHDLRDFAYISRIGRGLARQTRAKRVLLVGTDCNVGKMVTALELRKAAVAEGRDAAFVATGQTGIMIEGWGIAIDHVLSDFVAGAVEMLVEHAADREVMFIEGQGSLEHPGYSGVTLSLLHGACPDAMVLVHRPGQSHHSSWTDCPVAPVTQQIDLYECCLAPLHPGKVVAVAVNTAGMDPDAAEAATRDLAARTGLPTADPIRHGPATLWDAVRRHLWPEA
jgi:uncharacterized NAD-dependent epimerase/dehydratase family protein